MIPMSPTRNAQGMQISFVIAAYNIEAYIAECLQDVLRSVQDQDEIIVVNDGSTDGTQRIIGDMALAHPRIQIVDKPNGGLSSARNAGLAQAKGDYVLFLDGDDVVKPEAVGWARDVLETSQPDLLVMDYEDWLDDGRGSLVPSRARSHQPGQLSTEPVRHLRETLDDCIPSVWSRFFKRSLFAALPTPPFPEWSMYDDMPTTPYLVAAARTMLYLPRPLVQYRVRAGSLTRERTERSCTDMIKAAVHASGAVSKLPPDEALQRSADTFVARKMLDAIRQCRELRHPTVVIYREITDLGLKGIVSDHAALLRHLRCCAQPHHKVIGAHLRQLFAWQSGYVWMQAMTGILKARKRRRREAGSASS